MHVAAIKNRYCKSIAFNYKKECTGLIGDNEQLILSANAAKA